MSNEFTSVSLMGWTPLSQAHTQSERIAESNPRVSGPVGVVSDVVRFNFWLSAPVGDR